MKLQNGPSLRDKLGLGKRVSIVWTYFEKLSRVRVRCRLCRHEQNYQGTTGNILRHLKNKHNIDCTVRGRQLHPENMEVEVLDDAFQDLDNGNAEILQEGPAAKDTRISYGDETHVQPYAESNMIYDNAAPSNTYDVNITLQQAGPEKSPQPHFDKPESLEEERLMAEIEYFREKTSYYRMQRNLTALQAKKLKYELDHASSIPIQLTEAHGGPKGH